MSKLRIVPSQKFNRYVKLAIKRGYNIQLLDDVVEMIAEQQLLQRNIKITNLLEIIPAVGSVTLPPTGS